MPPFDPHALRAAALEPFVQTLRACLRHAGGLRVDHVMGLFRLWWIPEGAEPAAGGYVRYPADELLAVLALESVRARAVVIGEDLGTVEEHARRRLAEADVLSYRVLWFEDEAPSRWPRPALAAVTTHDLPTVAGLWTGRDVERQQRLGMSPNVDATCAIVERLRRETRLPADAPVDDVVVATYRLLHDAPSHLLVASLEDALGLEERPNMPGTTIPENWSQPFPLLLEEIERHPLVRRLVTALRDGG